MDTTNEVQSIKAVNSTGGIQPLNAAAGTTSPTGISRVGFQSCQVHTFAGVSEGTPTSFTLDTKLQHNTVATSGDGGWADADVCGLDSPATADLVVITAVSTEKRKAFNLNPAKEFVRVQGILAFVGGTTPKLNYGSILVLAGAVDKPVTL